MSLSINLSQFKPEGKFKFPGINFNQSELRELRIDRDYATSAALFHNFTFQISKYILDYTMSLVIQIYKLKSSDWIIFMKYCIIECRISGFKFSLTKIDKLDMYPIGLKFRFKLSEKWHLSWNFGTFSSLVLDSSRA